MTVLCVTAHPVDEVLGAGGTLAAHAAAGNDVHVCVLSNGVTSREQEVTDAVQSAIDRRNDCARRACDRLGVAGLSMHAFPVDGFDTVPLRDLVAKIDAEIDRHEPEVVYTHHPGTLAVDHEHTARATLLATRPLGESPVERLLAFAGLSGREDAPVTELSGGMRRRLALARALMNRPDLIVLDEPTTGLDPQARQYIWQSLRRLRAEGVTLVLTTHYMEEAERLCERLAIIDGGRIVAAGSPTALIREHIEPWVLELRGPAGLAWGNETGAGLARRCEEVGDTLLLYADTEGPLLEALPTDRAIDYHGRRANLEDVFLKLTGRELRD